MRCIGRASECGNDVVLSLDHIPSPETDEPVQRASVWWTWTAAASGILDIHTRGSDFDTVLAAWSGNDFATLAEVASNDDESLQSFVSVPVEAGQTI